MKALRENILLIFLVIGLAIGIYFLYGAIQPMAFLLGSGILFTLLYFFILLFTARNKNVVGDSRIIRKQSSIYSVIFFLLLFGISIKVMKDYQLPDDAYFTNIDHHTIRNTGIAFGNSIELYHQKSDTSRGIWPSDTGSFSITVDPSRNAKFQLRNFYTPVMGVKDEKIYLLNPQYKQEIAEGFTIGNAFTSLTWTDVSSRLVNDKRPFYSFKIIFSTTDTFFANTPGPSFFYTDTITIKDIEIRKGLDLRSIFKKADEFQDRLSGRFLRNTLTGPLKFT